MAKMFYTVEESASKLSMSEDEVRNLISSGQLQEFKDGDRVVLKAEQVDILAGDEEDGDDLIPLADSGELEPIGLSSSGTGSMFGADDPSEQTGISIFDPEGEDEEADPMAQTQISPSTPAPFSGDAGASGSGLMNIAQESDDTSLGGNLLDDVYGETQEAAATLGDSASADFGDAADSQAASAGFGTGMFGGDSVMGGSAMSADSGDLFEGAGEAEPEAQPMMMAAAEPYDGAGSGLLLGIGIAMTLGLIFGIAIVVAGLVGGIGLVDQILGALPSIWIIPGAIAGLMLICGGAGFAIMRRG